MEPLLEEMFVLGESVDNVHSRHVVRPSDILVRRTGAAGRFGKVEVEISVGRLVLFFRLKKGNLWTGFSLQELVKFYEENSWDSNMILFGLWFPWLDMATPQWKVVDHVLLVRDDRGMFHVTDRFIEACRAR